MNKWYVVLGDKAKGPYSDLEVRDKIQSQELKASTLVYKEGEADWRPLEEQDIWSPHFILEALPQVRSSKEWVLLVEDPVKKGELKQQGPFTQVEIQNKIHTGELHLKDYCWKPGMKDWKKLAELPEVLNTRKESIFYRSQHQEVINSQDLVSVKKKVEENVVEHDLPELLEWHPEEEELVQAPAAQVTSEPLLEAQAQQQVSKDAPLAFLPSLKESLAQRKRLKWILVLVALCFVLGLGLGKLQGPFIVSALEWMQSSLKSLTQTVSQQPAVGFVFLKPALSQKQIIYLQSDAKSGVLIQVKVQDQKGEFVPLKADVDKPGVKALELSADDLGGADINMNAFDLKPYETYKVVAWVGSFKAQIRYKHNPESRTELEL